MLATETRSSFAQPLSRSSTGQDYPAPESSSTRGHDEFKATLEEMRSNHRGEVSCSIPVVDVESFLNYLFPPLHDGVDVESVVASLRDEGLITSEDEWKAFQATSEKKDEEDESICLLFAEVFGKVIDSASRRTNVEPNFVLAMQRNAFSSDQKANRRRPSGYFILREAEERAHLANEKRDKMRWWYDIALTTEFRKKDNSRGRNANTSKIVLNIQQTLALDPCRRFTFGITAENTSMRLWLCSRATPVVSEVFDFTKGAKVLTRIFLAIAFASKVELGWDPTVRPLVRSNGERAYQIDVNNETYETEQVLSDNSADALVSQATRVWKVKHVASGKRCVLKDIWLEDGRDMEHAIHETILRDIGDKYGTEVKEEAALHLLTPIAHCLVHVNGEQDHTTSIMMRGYTPSMRHRFKIRVKRTTESTSRTHHKSTESSVSEFRRELRAPFPHCLHRREIYRRKHYRVVFKEVAEDLYDVSNLSDAFLVLRDVLRWIHGSGWVHRDISPGNLYLFEGRGLIGDLEYAKQRNFDIESEQATGTRDYMAVEAVDRSYSYLPSLNHGQAVAQLTAMLEMDPDEISAIREASRPTHPRFFHNDLHDLEPLWWIAIWKLFSSDCFEFDGGGDCAEDRNMMRQLAFSNLFHVSDGHRWSFFNNERIYDRDTTWIPESLHLIRKLLNNLRETLILNYNQFEAEFPATRTYLLEEAHDKVLLHFEACRRTVNKIKESLSIVVESKDPFSPVQDGIYAVQEPSIPSLEQD
ncbi:hypothetical protein A7U60_g2147 [Sanghuangporus baumii]|uniref:Protein kinase domain-containing protein n=1 Tax=Sanghuangporus baumii TaxID=108892 RepID=A0A9Q5I339_SANBA|nr:hypothetical protein A7U60_g2147 [Sanghuangporus baumii]